MSDSVSNVQEFLGIYNDIDRFIDSKTNYKEKGSYIKPALNELAETNRVVREYRRDLLQLIELRHVIVHSSTHKPIAEPYAETVKFYRELKVRLLQPKTARDIATSPVISFSYATTIEAAVKEMGSKNITNIPIVDNDQIKGVLSESSIIRWLADYVSSDGVLAEGKTLRDIATYLDSPDDRGENVYRFVGVTKDIFSIKDMFETAINNGKRLGAVFVTDTSKTTGRILGIITPWDLT